MEATNHASRPNELSVNARRAGHGRTLHEYRDAALTAIDFERYSRLVKSLLRTEVGSITLLDDEHQYALAETNSTGSDYIPKVLPRADTLCQYTIRQDNTPFVIEDLSQDSRFSSLGCVAGGPKLRTYAGFPIKTDEGYNIGSVCAFEDHLRQWTDEELGLLRDLGRMITNDLDLHFKNETIQMQHQMQCSIVSFIKSNLQVGNCDLPNSTITPRENLIAKNAATVVRQTLAVDSVFVLQLDRHLHSHACDNFGVRLLGTDSLIPVSATSLRELGAELCRLVDSNLTTFTLGSNLPETSFGSLKPHLESVLVAPWPDSQGRVAGFLLAATKTISRVFRSHEHDYLSAFGSTLMLEIQKAGVVDADQVKAQFISSLSHELRTPLHGLLHNAEVLSESRLDIEQAELVKDILACGNSQLSIVESMLNLNRAREQSKKENHISLTDKIDVVEVVEDAVVLAIERHRRRLHKLSKRDSIPHSELVQVVVDCPSGAAQMYLHQRLSNRKALVQIIEQLVSNALKWTETGFIKVGVGFSSEGANSSVSIDVCDTGSGIDQSFLRHKLFQTFSKEDSFSFGLGLGLSVVAESIAHLKGTIKVESEKGSYTAVHVSIPMVLAKDEPDLALHSLASGCKVGILYPEQSKSAGTRLLVRTLTRDLEHAGYHVCEYVNVSEADTAVLFVVENTKVSTLLQAADKLRVIYTGQLSPNSFFDSISHLAYQLGPHYGPRILRKLMAQIQQESNIPWDLLGTTDHASRKRGRSASHDLASQAMYSAESLADKSAIKARKYARAPERVPEHLETDIASPNSSITPEALETGPLDHAMDSSTVTPTKIGTNRAGDSPFSAFMKEPISPRVLIVEDNPTNARLLTRFMQKRGVDYKAVVNGQEAVDEIDSLSSEKKQAYDVILMDIQMPVLDGLQATERIRKMESSRSMPKAQIVACTGLSAEEDKQRATEVGCDNFLTKPISLVTLRHLFDDWSNEQTKENSSRTVS